MKTKKTSHCAQRCSAATRWWRMASCWRVATGSQRVIEKNGGVLIERFYKPAVYGGAESLRFRISLV